MEYKFKLLKGKCPSVPEPENGSAGFSLIPNDICMNALHAVFPYFLTLTSGGWLTWVEPGDGVIVQCANPDCSLQMKVFSASRDRVHGHWLKRYFCYNFESDGFLKVIF